MVKVVVKLEMAPIALATCELMGRRCLGQTPTCQLTTGGIPGGAKASTNTRVSR